MRAALGECLHGLRGVEAEAVEEFALGFLVPVRAEGGDVGEHGVHGHPRVEGDGVGHVGKAGFHGDIIALRVESEDADGAGGGAEQVQ